MDVLQNIEFSIVQLYRAKPELTDHHVDSAIEALYRSYRANDINSSKEKFPSNPLTAEVYQAVKAVCEWRLGHEDMRSKQNKKIKGAIIELDALTDCLKTLRKSIKLWTKQGGRQGYLNYINQFL
jgi:hypothetical protein